MENTVKVEITYSDGSSGIWYVEDNDLIQHIWTDLDKSDSKFILNYGN